MKKGQLLNVLVTSLVGVLVIISLIGIASKGAKLWQQNAEASKLQHFESFSRILKALATQGEDFTYVDGVATIPSDKAYVVFNNGGNARVNWPNKFDNVLVVTPSACSGTCICYFSVDDFPNSALDHVPCTNFPADTLIYSRLDSKDTNYGEQKYFPVEVDGNSQYETVVLTTLKTIKTVYFDKVYENNKNYIYVGFYDEEYQEKRINQLR